MMGMQRVLLAITGLCLSAMLVTACAATPRAPTPAQLEQFREDGKVVVLLQIVVKDLEDIDGSFLKPFDNPGRDDNVRFVLGNFETGGVPQKLLGPRFVSVESRDQGWTYLLLSPETNYLAIAPAFWTNVYYEEHLGQMAPRYVIDIPGDASVVYGGSLYIPGKRRSLAFGGYTINYLDNGRAQVRNHVAKAKQLATEYFSELGPIHTVLIEPHTTGTYQLRPLSR